MVRIPRGCRERGGEFLTYGKRGGQQIYGRQVSLASAGEQHGFSLGGVLERRHYRRGLRVNQLKLAQVLEQIPGLMTTIPIVACIRCGRPGSRDSSP